jgi:hypothetical protein
MEPVPENGGPCSNGGHAATGGAVQGEIATHDLVVRTWFTRVATVHPELDVLVLLDHAFQAVWSRAQRTLGDVTLAAILDRVVATETERHPFLVHVRVEYAGLFCDGLYDVRSSVTGAELGEGLQALLVTFLSILGELTAEILSAALHGELDSLDIERIALASARAGGDIPRVSR